MCGSRVAWTDRVQISHFKEPSLEFGSNPFPKAGKDLNISFLYLFSTRQPATALDFTFVRYLSSEGDNNRLERWAILGYFRTQ